jgi:hypothetical protein
VKTKNNLKALRIKEADSTDNFLSWPMLSLDASKAILTQHGITYTDEEIVMLVLDSMNLLRLI